MVKSSISFNFTCTRCGRCCFERNTIVNLACSDILRIHNGLKLAINELLEVFSFYIVKESSSANNMNKMVISPIATENDFAYVGLRKKENGQCYFYDAENLRCRIYAIRPNFCRTFPFSFSYDKKGNLKIFYTEKGKNYCPGIDPSSPAIILEEWLNLGSLVLKDLEYNEIIVKKWNERIKRDKIPPTAKGFIEEILKLK
jgi:Fe-S-cluster containining protein